jgi:hypothetical protein
MVKRFIWLSSANGVLERSTPHPRRHEWLSMAPAVPHIHLATRPSPPTVLVAQVAQPIGVALLVAVVSLLALFVLIRGVLATGGGIPVLLIVVSASAVVLAVGLRLLFRQLGRRSAWPMAIALTVADLVVYVALLITGTQSPSIVSLGPEAVIASVALATGSASTIVLRGWYWRMVGVAGVIVLLWLFATPALVVL